jgi:hypothetical protein
MSPLFQEASVAPKTGGIADTGYFTEVHDPVNAGSLPSAA